MGWTWQESKFRKDNGTIDRKAECDHIINYENDKVKLEVLKSAMKGSVYYAAVKRVDKTNGDSIVFGAVFLTSTDRRSWCDFGYKDMDETCGPYESECPKSILELLTETDSECAKEWRERCWANVNRPKDKSLASVKIGQVIEFNNGYETIRVRKMAPAYQFKTPWYFREENNTYVKKNHIKNWTLVETA